MVVTIETESHGILWARELERGQAVIVKEDFQPLMDFIGKINEDVIIKVS